MKQIISTTLLSLALLGSARAVDPALPQGKQMSSLINEIQSQQATIADNQAKIEARLAPLAEALRVAKIYSSRGGR